MTLTTEDARWLKTADALCFDMHADGTARIRAIRRRDNGDVAWNIDALDNRVSNYGTGDGPWVGFHMEMHPSVSDVCQTLIRHLRTGHDFVLLWTRNNDNDLLREAGLVSDELRIRIGKPDSKRADTYLITRQVTRDNTARMIRRA